MTALHDSLRALERPAFERIFMGLAVALSRRSTCSRLQVGCVITSTDWRHVFGVGYNGGAAGQENDCESLEPGKCGHLHAEENAIINSHAPPGVAKYLFSKNMPCPMCCKRIVNFRNVERVYFADRYRAGDGILTLQRAKIEVVHLPDYEWALPPVTGAEVHHPHHNSPAAGNVFADAAGVRLVLEKMIHNDGLSGLPLDPVAARNLAALLVRGADECERMRERA